MRSLSLSPVIFRARFSASTLFAVAAWALSAQSGFGQTDGARMPAAPSGFSRPSPVQDLTDTMDSALRRFQFQALFSAMYDSNVTQSSSENNDRPAESTLVLGLGGNISYGGAYDDWSYGAGYQFGYDQYLGDYSDLSGFNQQGFSGALNYKGGKLGLGASFGLSLNEGANRFYGEVIRQAAFTYGLSANYRVSPKTSLAGSLNYSHTRADGDAGEDTSALDFNLAGMWRMSSRTSFGPGLRYTYQTGDNQPDRETLGPTLNFNYRMSTKVSLSSRIGVNFVDYEGDSADPTLSTSIGLTYRVSQLWGLNGSLYRDAQPDPRTSGSYDEITSLRLGCYRKIRRATANLGVGYELASSENSGTGAAVRDDRQYLTFDSSISLPAFSDRVLASLFFKYRDQSSDNRMDNWDSYQLGFAISSQF